MNLLNMLMSSMNSQSSVNSLSQQTGVSSSALKKLLPILIPILLKYLTSNASSTSGAQSLLGALTQHTSKKSLAEQIDEVDQKDGAAIIKHILGDDKERVVVEASKKSGVKEADVEKSLSSIAPALLSSLSAATDSASQQTTQASGSPLDFSSLLGIFGGTEEEEPAPAADTGILSLFGNNDPKPQQTKPQSSGGFFSLFTNLFGGGVQQQQQQEDTSSFDGSSLLSTLLGMMK